MKNRIPTPKEVLAKLKMLPGKRPLAETRDDIFIKLNGNWYVIPKAFLSDIASVPWLLTFFIDRFDYRLILFSLLHDYFYRTQFVPRFYADAIYALGLKETAGWFISNAFYIGLRLGGWVAWKNNKKKGLEKHPEAYQRLINHICKVEKTEIQK